MLPLFDQAILVQEFDSPLTPKKEARAYQAKLSAAILQAMRSLSVGDTKLVTRVEFDMANFADMVAEVALGSSVILRLNRDLPQARRESVKTFADALIRVSGTIEESRLEAAIEKLAEVLLPDELEDARGILAADNLELRDRFLLDVPQLNSVEIGKKAGSSAKNGYATAARWKKYGDIFSVQHRGTEHFPAFQFQDGRPHPTIARVLATLPKSMTAWQKAFWFVSSNGWLDDAPPVEFLNDPEALVVAAQRENDEVLG